MLLEGQLDQALKDELGMSDDQIDRLSPPDKITRFRDDFLRRSVTESVGSASGLIPVKTFEAVDTEGNSAIGVVVVFSERMARVAASIASRGLRPIATSSSRSGSMRCGSRATTSRSRNSSTSSP